MIFFFLFCLQMYKLNHKKDPHDSRDYHVIYKNHVIKTGLPSNYTIPSYQLPPVFNQGNLGSCTANALSTCFYQTQIREQIPRQQAIIGSRNFIYYFERALINTINSDSGAFLGDGMKVLSKQGVCSEKIWPYIISKFTVRPSNEACRLALQTRIKTYARLNINLNQFKASLSNNYSIVVGIQCFPSIFKAPNGNVPLPTPGQKTIGGHAVTLIGFDDGARLFIFLNSWGTNWGTNGLGTFSYDYLRYVMDAWIMTTLGFTKTSRPQLHLLRPQAEFIEDDDD